ncbi:MAG: winged helix-turn-helix domain-containing protein, partial [Candidatus Nanohaloarchaea archaeon]|nr:winged helix-turn-helix domain-containing protein [Candidatus Nanohaloarchaea archaeon]
MPEDLDEETIDALSSETRREILKLLKGHEKNPTFIAREVGKHKSTIAEHLDILREAGLVEKDDEPGRRRTTYSLTRTGERVVAAHP